MVSTDTIVRVCRRVLPEYDAVYLFGSLAQGEVHAGSDVDLAVLPCAPLSAVERFDLAQEVAVALGADVDLIDLLGASTVLQMEIVTKGGVIDDRRPVARQLFEARVYSSYAMLNEERAGIVADARARGRTHAR